MPQKEGIIMKKVLVLCPPDDSLKNCFSGIRSAEIVFSDILDIPPDTGCVMIAQSFSDASLSEIRRICRSRNLPAAVITENASEQNQALLLDLGFDHILLLPMSEMLIEKQIRALPEGMVTA